MFLKMKRIVLFLAVGLSAVALQAKTLIVYYSYTNNVHRIVSDLQTQIEADVLRVEPAEEGLDYAADNYALGSALIGAIRNDPDNPASYPAIKTTVDNLADYDTVIVGAPLWWSNMAAPLQTFLFTYGSQMAGKRIGLIVSSASSGISGVEADARRLIPQGDFMSPSLWIRSSQTSNCHAMITDWLDEIGYEPGGSGIDNPEGFEEPRFIVRPGQLTVVGYFDEWSLYGLRGDEVLRTFERSADVSHLPAGLYVARLRYGVRAVSYKVRIGNERG